MMVSETRSGARGALMPPHSMARSAVQMARRTRNSQPPNHTDAMAMRASTSPETSLTPRLDQKRLAGREDVSDLGAAVASLPTLELIDCRLQVLWPIVRPQHVLEDELGIGRLP